MEELTRLTLHEARRRLDAGEITSVQLTEAFLKRIKSVDSKLHAYLTVTNDLALEQAHAADAKLRQGQSKQPMLGLPIALKDVLSTKGIRTTCGSKFLENYVPPWDGTAVSRLRKAGAVFLGKTNTDEFAMGSSTENSAYGPTRNPWSLEHVPGGSSGGSAAAVAADECLAALGTDTGGSVRQPASFTGIVGLKPTYGLVSRYGLVAFASSLDQIGPLTKDVQDAALLLDAIAGHDPRDSTSAPRIAPTFAASLEENARVEGLRLGVPTEWMSEGLHPEVARSVQAAIQKFEGLGATVREIALPMSRYAIPIYYILAPAEASANLARYDGVRYGLRVGGADEIFEMLARNREAGFGPEVKRRIMLGTYALSAGYQDAYYKKAQSARTLLKEEFDRAFEQVDLIIGPTAPSPAFRLGEHANDPLAMYLEDIYTIPVNLAGLPAISLPCGFAGELPIGLQLIAPAWQEERLLGAAYRYEQATEWHKQRPKWVSAPER
ncbi:MAG: Asp-tRNA(Asn)/Glu-tRNA(Gln) amidotransferase subunit GatA [Ardenticatenales bacterium]|nr:Asp-tRNA(Asn)/Glu-tRNA(Gln) amidotransferase subunit GatA [Ardenticatenales bacterium]